MFSVNVLYRPDGDRLLELKACPMDLLSHFDQCKNIVSQYIIQSIYKMYFEFIKRVAWRGSVNPANDRSIHRCGILSYLVAWNGKHLFWVSRSHSWIFYWDCENVVLYCVCTWLTVGLCLTDKPPNSMEAQICFAGVFISTPCVIGLNVFFFVAFIFKQCCMFCSRMLFHLYRTLNSERWTRLASASVNTHQLFNTARPVFGRFSAQYIRW